jgi:preprotein translocase subunit SecA
MWPAFLSSPPTVSRRVWRLANDVVQAAGQLHDVADQELTKRAVDLRYEIQSGQDARPIMGQLFPLVLEASRRHLGMCHYPVQVAAGILLTQGAITEMQTGEGKTLVATLPLTYHAMSGIPTHLATANDYLAKRDAESMRPVYESLGLSVSSIAQPSTPVDRQAAYASDITYSTAREFGFDFLRDRIHATNEVSSQSVFHQTVGQLVAYSGVDSSTRSNILGALNSIDRAQSKQVQRKPFGFILVDEADSILIDEARTPLIISSEIGDQATHEEVIRWCSKQVDKFTMDEHIQRDSTSSQFEFTRTGHRVLRSLAKPALLKSVSLSEIAEAMLRAVYVDQSLHRDEHYVIVEDEVKIVDEYTGRIADGRKWRNGIHQAVEVREGVPMTALTLHAAKITLPEYLRQYQQLSGMTGTATSAANELQGVYGLHVVRIPTNKKSRRASWPAHVSRTSDDRWQAIAEEVDNEHAKHRPVLIGTRTVEQSEKLSALLSEKGLQHEVLNALNHESEAKIVAEAGQVDRITVATNMAGRGTDIKLSPEAEKSGGLHVVCSELHTSARIDRQLAGRCARQGDPGTVRQFMSLEDEVLRESCGPELIDSFVQSIANASNRGKLKAITKAQSRVEKRHEQDRRLLLHHSQMQINQQLQLGQDPWLAQS